MNSKGFFFIVGLFIAEICSQVESETFKILKSFRSREFLSQKYGYSIEEHRVQTSDGFILKIHRVPSSPKNGNKATKKYPTFLLHGLVSSSLVFFVTGRKSLPLILADAGYDVWLGNARGTYFSLNHTRLDYETSNEFWDFSLHDIGLYDIPPMIDYVLNYTQKDKLHYIGHSQGAGTFFVMMSEYPAYNSKILSMHALAPATFMKYNKNPLVLMLANVFAYPSEALYSFSKRPVDLILHNFSVMIADLCKLFSTKFCSMIIYNTFGYNANNTATTTAINLFETAPQGASIKCMIHFLQAHKSGKFRRYDYGKNNIERYGTIHPPEYNLTQVACPVHLYYSQGDTLVAHSDVATLSLALPKKFIYLNYTVPLKYNYNHIDYLFARNAKEIIYDKILKSMKNIERYT